MTAATLTMGESVLVAGVLLVAFGHANGAERLAMADAVRRAMPDTRDETPGETIQRVVTVLQGGATTMEGTALDALAAALDAAPLTPGLGRAMELVHAARWRVRR